MALSGTISGSYDGSSYDCELRWSATQNITNNTSTIKAQWYLIKVASNSTSFNNSGTSTVSLTIDGSSYSKVANFDLRSAAVGTELLLATFSKTVTHANDGTKSVSVSGRHTTNIALGTANLSGTASLNTIPRASSISASAMTMGTASTITVTKKNASFTHRVYYSFGSISNAEITSGAVSGNVSFTPSLNLANQIPNATSANMSIRCVTYNGSSQVGTATISVKLSVPSDMKPSVSSLTLTEAISGLNTKFGAFIQGRSKLSGTVNTTIAYGSAIASYRVEINGAVYTSRTFTTDYLRNSGSQTARVTVTDRRGRSSTVFTRSYSVTAYTEPNITLFRVARYSALNTADNDGQYIRIFVNGVVSSLSNRNDLILKYRYKLASASTYTEASITISSYNFTYASGLISGFSANSAYNFQAVLTDYFGDTIALANLPTAFTTIDIKADGNGVAFGKVAETANCLDVGFHTTKISRYINMGEANNNEKRIQFLNSVTATDAPNGVYKHNCYLYGGNSGSAVSFGIYDTQNNRTFMSYQQSTSLLKTSASNFLFNDRPVDTIRQSTNASDGTSVRVSQDGYCVICGRTTITPSAANTPTSKEITYGKTFLKLPNVQVTAHSGLIGTQVLGVSINDPTTTKVDIVLTRTNTTTTTIYWRAEGFISV